MVHEMTGDLLSCDADYICHQTNFYGVMGAGVAASIHSKLLSPAAYSAYQRLCRKMGRDLLGKVQYLPGTSKEPGGRSYIVFNLFCQDDRARADRGLTRYDCMRSCLEQVECWARENGCKRVALPGIWAAALLAATGARCVRSSRTYSASHPCLAPSCGGRRTPNEDEP